MAEEVIFVSHLNLRKQNWLGYENS